MTVKDHRHIAKVAAILAVLIGLSLISTPAAYGSHTSALGVIEIFKCVKPIFPLGTPPCPPMKIYTSTVACTGASCSLNVAMPKVDALRFARLCGNPALLTLPAGYANTNGKLCTKSGPWQAWYNVALFDSAGHATYAYSDVEVEFHAVSSS